MNQEEKDQQYRDILGHYLPKSAVEPILLFIKKNSIFFHISGRRTSKLGDYRMPRPDKPFHEISVNGDLPPHLFLLVLLHEMAHYNTFIKYGRTVQPHGHQWQTEYRNLMVTFFNDGHFPEETRNLFAKYTAKIPLNRAAGQELESALRNIDRPEEAARELLLKDLPLGTAFIILNGHKIVLRSTEKLRTRFKCTDVFSGEHYLVSGNAPVKEITDEQIDRISKKLPL